MKKLLILFGVLDVLLFTRFIYAVYAPVHILSSDAPALAFFTACLQALFILSLITSAYGLIHSRRWAFFFSYAQFPFRFLFALFSFGFLSVLSKWLNMPNLYQPLIYAAMGLEVARLAFTIAVHKGEQKLRR